MTYSDIRYLVLGKTGSGKTYFVKNLINKFLSLNLKRIIIFDVHSEYRFNNAIIFYSLKSFLDYLKYYNDKFFVYIFRFESEDDYKKFLSVAYNITDYLLVLDEASFYIDKNNKAMQKILRFGRHKNIGFVGVTRRFYELSKEFRALIYNIVSFKQTEINDITELKKIGFKKIDLLNLEKHEYEEISL